MTRLDLLDIWEMESTTFPDPWPMRFFLDCLNSGYDCWVLEKDAAIRAYAIMTLESVNAHLLNLCVHNDYQRLGLGRLILTHLVNLAQTYSSHSIFLEVRPSNQAAIHLYHSMGFVKVTLQHGYYPGSSRAEDAMVMAKQFCT